MKKGDIVLVPFPFTDLSGNKNRRALVLIESEYDVTVSFLTTRLQWLDEHDFIIYPSDFNGLKKHSAVRLAKIATLDKELILGRLGSLEQKYLEILNTKLILLFKLNI